MSKQQGSSQLLRRTERWVGRHLHSLKHERRVFRLAMELFKLTKGHHGLEREHALLLAVGALVHDVGRSVDDKRHPMIGAELLLNDESLPLTDRQRRQVAYLTRYHRGAVPKAGYDDILKTGDSRKAMRRVMGLLRAADTLDHRRLPSPHVAAKFSGGKLLLEVEVDEATPQARKAFSRRKKFRLLEETLGCKVEVRVSERAVRAGR